MLASHRFVLLTAAVLLLPACPALLPDDFEAVDGHAGTGNAGSASGGGDGTTERGGASAMGGEAGLGDPGVGGSDTGGTTLGGSGGQTSGGTGGPGSGGSGEPTSGGTGAVSSGGTGGSGAGASGGATSGGAGTGGMGGMTSGGSGGVTSGGHGGATVGGSAGVVSGGSAGDAGATGDAGDGGGGAVTETGGTGGGSCLGSTADCEALRSSIVHRYRFDGTGTAVTDSAGDAHGVVRGGATLSGEGDLTLAGGSSGEYVDLPNGIVHELANATFEVWVEWGGGAPWQRVFDFGDAMTGTSCTYDGPPAGDGNDGICGRTYLYLVASTDTSSGSRLRAAYMRQPGVHPDDRREVEAPSIAVSAVLQLVVVMDDTNHRLSLYVDGHLESSISLFEDDELSEINDVNNWLGRSQFYDDVTFTGTYLEFRIYAAALSSDQIAMSYEDGPDGTLLD
ncbi:MAG: hypothetical protein JW751_17745 [Polyangiaceae bacterium]|nr:hypothetical protein [Polyangiaceae bacterium]